MGLLSLKIRVRMEYVYTIVSVIWPYMYILNLYTYNSVHNKLVGLRCLPTQVAFKSTLKPFINDTAAPKGTASTALFLHTAV